MTIDLARLAIVAEVPVSRYFMGPFSVSASSGLATFGSNEHDGLVAVSYTNGSQTPLVSSGDFGTIVQYSAAFSRAQAFAVNVYPPPTRWFTLDLSAGAAPRLAANVTFSASVHALSAAW